MPKERSMIDLASLIKDDLTSASVVIWSVAYRQHGRIFPNLKRGKVDKKSTPTEEQPCFLYMMGVNNETC